MTRWSDWCANRDRLRLRWEQVCLPHGHTYCLLVVLVTFSTMLVVVDRSFWLHLGRRNEGLPSPDFVGDVVEAPKKYQLRSSQIQTKYNQQ